MYSLLRPLLFKLEPETAHAIVLSMLKHMPNFLSRQHKAGGEINAMGINFAHAIGLAAGFDKNGEYLDGLAKLGFAWIEIGTVTPREQPGNPQPRLFRLPEAAAIINRMGFNNQGIKAVINNLRNTTYQGILGINIGKNKDTQLASAADDYLYCLEHVYTYASYVTINISSPNTPGLRELQSGNYFIDLIQQLRKKQLSLADLHKRYVPLVIKCSPDESDETLKRMAEIVKSQGIDGLLATNTTCRREAVSSLPHGNELGGLSGAPLAERSTQCLRILKSVVGDDVILIASGGIDSVEIARQKIAAGADLLQLYTGLVYQGPGLIRKLVDGL